MQIDSTARSVEVTTRQTHEQECDNSIHIKQMKAVVASSSATIQRVHDSVPELYESLKRSNDLNIKDILDGLDVLMSVLTTPQHESKIAPSALTRIGTNTKDLEILTRAQLLQYPEDLKAASQNLKSICERRRIYISPTHYE